MIIHGESLKALSGIEDNSIQMIYIDPPFNTGKVQTRRTQSMLSGSSEGTHTGFGGRKYSSNVTSVMSYNDSFVDFWGFLEPHIIEAKRVLTDTGTIYLHLDYREVHYAKVMLDSIFGRECFLNEIIWAYDYGAKSKKKWPTKHDNILVYVKSPDKYYFNSSEVDREPYMAPGLVTTEKAALGKLPTDVWWHTIVPTNGKEKTGYPTQKPEGIIRRMVTASTVEGDTVLDFFAGSGTSGAVATKLGRKTILVDNNEKAVDVMRVRLPDEKVVVIND